jgi:superfamily II DNA or RNA helicase
MLRRRTKREVVFLSGDDKTDTREEWRQKMIKEKNIALIATYGIFQQGINIPNLKHGIFASPSKSKIRVLQSVGRTLRAHNDERAYIYDIIDECKFLSTHGEKRLDYYENEGFEIETISV